jgi:hypothetical protein
MRINTVEVLNARLGKFYLLKRTVKYINMVLPYELYESPIMFPRIRSLDSRVNNIIEDIKNLKSEYPSFKNNLLDRLITDLKFYKVTDEPLDDDCYLEVCGIVIAEKDGKLIYRTFPAKDFNTNINVNSEDWERDPLDEAKEIIDRLPKETDGCGMLGDWSNRPKGFRDFDTFKATIIEDLKEESKR